MWAASSFSSIEKGFLQVNIPCENRVEKDANSPHLEHTKILPKQVHHEVEYMPIYEYRCDSCGHEMEKMQKLADDPLKDCPSCNEPTLKKLISAVGFRLKGEGWYETDFKTGDKKNLAGDSGDKGDSSGGSADSKSSSSESSDTGSSKTSKSADKPASSSAASA